MTEFLLVRHGQTDWNRLGRVQGRTDVPLNTTGRAEARHIAEIIAGLDRLDAIAASPLSRAAETAQIIAARRPSVPLLLRPGLIERDHGSLEGLSPAERRRLHASGRGIERLESREDVVERVHFELSALAADNPVGRVVVVSHGGVIRSLLHVAEGVEAATREAFIANGSAHRFLWREDLLTLVEFNAAASAEHPDSIRG